ncbi:MAG: class I SAM-dependent methyltransferase [Pseudomonadota bacterium]
MPTCQLKNRENRLCLQWQQLEICVDFLSPKQVYRQRQLRREMLTKAIGIKAGKSLKVIDATAGLGNDAFIIASLGCSVILLERSDVVIKLLEDGLSRASKDKCIADIVNRMTLIQTDSIAYLRQIKDDDKPDVVYLDPMFPQRSKSALVKKEMQVLQSLLGHDNDADDLLLSAMNCATQRVVLKRPRLAKSLTSLQPSFILSGRSSRFDVYVK